MEGEYWTNWQGPAAVLDTLSFQTQLLRNVYGFGFESLISLQQLAVPTVLSGRNLLCQAPSGSGKTTVHAISLMHLIDPAIVQIQALVLCPAREICLSIARYMAAFSDGLSIKIHPCVGGMRIKETIAVLQSGVHIVIGTPGRMLDCIKRGIVSLERLKIVVLEETDELMCRGFQDQIGEMFQFVPEKAQIAVFSGGPIPPLPFKVENPIYILPQPAVRLQTQQKYQLSVPNHHKFAALLGLLDQFYGIPILIRCEPPTLLPLLTELLEKGRRIGALLPNIRSSYHSSTAADVTNEAVLTSSLFEWVTGHFKVVIHYETPSMQLFQQSLCRNIKVNKLIGENLPVVVVFGEDFGLPELPEDVIKPIKVDYTVLDWIRTKEHWYLPAFSSKEEALKGLILQIDAGKVLICCNSETVAKSLAASFPAKAVLHSEIESQLHSLRFLTYSYDRTDYSQDYDTAVLYDQPPNIGEYLRLAALSPRTVSLVDREEQACLQDMQATCSISPQQWPS